MKTKYTPTYFFDKALSQGLKENKRFMEIDNGLPPSFKLYLNQIKIILKHNCKEPKEITESETVLKNITKGIEDIIKKGKSIEDILEEKENKLKELSERNE